MAGGRTGGSFTRTVFSKLRRGALAAALLTALPVVCWPQEASSPPYQLHDCDATPGVPAGAECARLSVPENPANPQGRQVSLNIMRVKALTPAAEDPLFVIVGGPGGAAVRSAHQYLPYFRGLQKRRDIVFVDQRGTGESNGLPCTFDEIELARVSPEYRLQRTRELVETCVSEMDADLSFYTTPHAVEDLERVRRKLGYSRVNLWGVSYGTRVILQYLRMYPESVRTAVLDGAAPVAIQLPRFVAEDGSRALEKIFNRCATDSACRTAYGDLHLKWQQLMARLEDADNEITVDHPRSGESVTVQLSPVAVSGWVRVALYSRELAPLIPYAVSRAVAGDYGVLGGISLLAVEDIAEQISQGMQLTVLCAEDGKYPAKMGSALPEGLSHNSRSGDLLYDDQAEVFSAACAQLEQSASNQQTLAPSYYEPVISDIPVLVFSGDYDPVTPPRWGDWVASTLGNSRHLVVPGAHHGAIMHGCTARLVREFVETADPAAPEPNCLQQIKPPAFFIDAAGPALSSSDAEESMR